MESANSHHQLQDQFVGSSPSLATPSCYGVLGTTAHAWTTTPSPTSIFETRQQQQQESPQLVYNSNMGPDLSFHWPNNNTTSNFTTNNMSPQDHLNLSRIKEELISDHYYRKYSEMILSNSSPQSTTSDEYDNIHRNLQQQNHEDVVGTKLLLRSLSSGDHQNNNGAARGFVMGHQQIFPSINVSNNLNPAGSLDMNLEALDLLASSRFSGNNFGQNQIGIFRDGFSTNYGFDHMQQSYQFPAYGSNKVLSASSNVVVVGEAKRASGRMEPKAPLQNAPKKSRIEARSSCPPFKVRKEKLGDRIAALQQLVAPFGKTDTASVLMEAIGYIKFLQNQVETLSVPYMKASRNKSSRVMKGGPAENESEEPKRDLKSRGLCLVPLSCLSYIADGGGAVVWPPPHFGGAA